MPEPGSFFKADAVRFERILAATPERAWEFLTIHDRLPGWHGKGAMEPYPGGVASFMDGHVRGIVTQWNPPGRLAYAWNVYSPGETEPPYPESYVSFELSPQGEDTRLLLTHMPVLERFVRQNAMGWHAFLDMLDDALRGKSVRPRAEYMKTSAALYGADLSSLQQ